MRIRTQKKMLELLGMAERKFYRAGLTMQGAKLQEAGRMLPTMLHVIGGMEPQEQERYRGIIEGMQQALAQLPAQPDRATFRETCHLCRDLMKLAEENLQKEKCRKLIVFLPYKASMWDSLESIWMAAYKDREHCQTMVVPIPYGDRNPDGTAAEWHYEIDQYPKYVPVIDHRSVDLEKLHPDVIFIHNPYDNYNAVTSVDMRYYSKHLKKWTDDLIYVPYYVSGETIGASFCQMPGVINADHVIVQDENVKEQFESYYPGGNPPAGKFLALGSPKFDKIIMARREDYTLPEQWLHLMAGRTVILYNTCINAMLEYRDTYCQKLRQVLRYFHSRPDVILWWRPHPLLVSSFQSMNTAHYEEYMSLVREYQEEQWGIYDDTSDMERSIVCTDAYYGDHSSLVPLYQCTGKPILLQAVERSMRDRWPLTAYNVVVSEREIRFLPISCGFLFRMPRGSQDVTAYPLENQVKGSGFQRYGALQQLDAHTFLAAPLLADDFCFLDEQGCVVKRVSVQSITRTREAYKYLQMFKTHGCCYCVGREKGTLLRYSLADDTFTAWTLPASCKTEYSENLDNYLSAVSAQYLCVGMMRTNKILICDLDTGAQQLVQLAEGDQIATIAAREQLLCVKTQDGQVVFYDLQQGQIAWRFTLPAAMRADDIATYLLTLSDMCLYVTATLQSRLQTWLLCVNLQTREAEYCRLLDHIGVVEFMQWEQGEMFWMGYTAEGQDYIRRIDLQTLQCDETYCIRAPRSVIEHMQRAIVDVSPVYNEKLVPLVDLPALAAQRRQAGEHRADYMPAGEKIKEYVL